MKSLRRRLEEIFEAVAKELKKAGRAGKLPSGVVLTGGSAKIKGITEYAKELLGWRQGLESQQAMVVLLKISKSRNLRLLSA